MKHTKQFLTIRDVISKLNGVQIIEADFTEGFEAIIFTYNGNHTEIYYREDGFLSLAYQGKDEKELAMFNHLLTDLLKTRPCLSFDEKTKEDEDVMHCLEWYQDDSTSHVIRMMLANDNNELSGITNFKIITGREEYYYREMSKKVPGLYPGNLTKDEVFFLDSCSEFNIYYMMIKKVEEYRKICPDYINIDAHTFEQNEARFAIEYLACKLHRFGVPIEPSKDYSPVNLDMDYAIWLESWNTYFASLDDETRARLNEMASNMEDVYPWLYTVNSNLYEDGIKHILIDRSFFSY